MFKAGTEFQFYNSSIKTHSEGMGTRKRKYFNSTIVRLKRRQAAAVWLRENKFQFYNSSIKTDNKSIIRRRGI